MKLFDAYVYFFFIGSGLATGFLVVGFIGWKLYNRSIAKNAAKGNGGRTRHGIL